MDFPNNYKVLKPIDFIWSEIMRDYKENDGLPVYYVCSRYKIDDPNAKKIIKEELEACGLKCRVNIHSEHSTNYTDRWAISISEFC